MAFDLLLVDLPSTTSLMIQMFFFSLFLGNMAITKAETSVSLEIKKKKKLIQAPFEFQSLASEFIIDFRISSVAAYGIPVMPVSQDTPSLPNHPKFLQPVCCLGTEL